MYLSVNSLENIAGFDHHPSLKEKLLMENENLIKNFFYLVSGFLMFPRK